MPDVRQQHHHNRYFWWGSVRLDSDPLGKRPKSQPCVEDLDANCDEIPLYIWVHPGLLEKALILSALPALLLIITIVRGLAHLGISELLSFMLHGCYATLHHCVVLRYRMASGSLAIQAIFTSEVSG